MKKQLLLFLLLIYFCYGAFAQTTYYVTTDGNNEENGTSWSTAFSTVQKAIDVAVSGDNIFVKKGRYLLESSISMKEGVKIYGSFAGIESFFSERVLIENPSILDGQNKRRVIYNNTSLSQASVLDGFVITGGKVTGNGGGIYNNGASPTLRNLIINNNTATGNEYDGGGGAMYNEFSNPTLINVIISDNYAGIDRWEVEFGENGEFNFINSHVTGYHGFGGAMYNNYSNPTLINVLITRNYLQGPGDGPGIYNKSSSPTLTNVTISNGTHSIFNDFGSSHYIRNCIILGNGDRTIYNENDFFSASAISYSLVEGNDGRRGKGNLNGTNINEEDLFVGSGNYNLKPSPNNPVINKGSNSFYTSKDLTDLQGFDRFNGTVDMGAFEYHFPEASEVVISGNYQVDETLTGTYKYSDVDGSVESGSTYQWYRANDEDGSGFAIIKDATNSTYIPTTDDLGKYIAFEVIPSDGIEGEPARSGWGKIVNKIKEQAITFAPLASKTYGEVAFDPKATASSGLDITYRSSNSDVATILEGKIQLVGAGTAVITASQAGNDGWRSAMDISQELVIDKKILEVTADEKFKVYGAADPVFAFTATGFVNGDDESILSGVLTRKSGEDVGNYAIGLGTLSAGANYSVDFTASDFEIIPAVVTITTTSQSKVYGERDPAIFYTATGFVNGDDETILSGELTREAGEDAGSYAIQLGRLSAGANYTINFTGADFIIAKKMLELTISAPAKEYDGTLNAAVSLEVNPLDGDAVTVNYSSATFDDKNVGSAKNVFISGISLEGEDAVNYSVYSTTTIDADITAKGLRVTADKKSKAYGDPDPTLTYTITGLATGDDESILSGSLTREEGEASGTYVIQLGSLSAGQNYTINFTTADFVISNKKVLTVTADTKGKAYGDTDPLLTYSTIGFVNGDDESILNGKLTREAGEDAGTYAIGLGTLSAGPSYTINFTGADFTIDKKKLSLTAVEQDKEYDGNTDAAVNLQVDPINGDAVAVNYTSAEFGDKNVGTDKKVYISGISLSGDGAANYSVDNTATTAADITAKPLTVTADSKSKAYGDTDPKFTYTATGFAAGDDESILSGALTREAGEDAGTYMIGLGNLSAGANYTISFNKADFVISNKKVLTVTADVKSKSYGDADPVLTYKAIGFEDGDDESILSGDLSREAGEVAGSYAIQLGSLSAGSNYTINFTGADFMISKRELSISAVAEDKVYDGNTSVTLSLHATPIIGDSLVVNYGVAEFIDKNVGVNKMVFISQITISGDDAGNYSVSDTELASANITAKVLTINADKKIKSHGDSDPPLTFTVRGFVKGDNGTVLKGILTREQGEEVGTYAIQLGSLSADQNYTINFTTAEFVISDKKVLTVTADTKGKVYGDADPVFTYTATGFANGDDESILSGALIREVGEDAGTYAIGLGSLSAGSNYTINFTGADFMIGKKKLSLTAVTKDKEYDGNTSAAVILQIDPNNGDAVTVNYRSAEFGDKNVGTDKKVFVSGISLIGDDAANYSVDSTETTAVDITTKPLTVTVDSKSKAYGDTDPSLTYTVTGFAAGDDESILSGSLTREAGEDAGTYMIGLGNLSAGPNYTIVFKEANFVVSDNDGVPDETEEVQGTDPDEPQHFLDSDKDGVADHVEVQKGTNPNNGSDYPDTDNDHVPDYVEERDGTDLNDPQDFLDSDNDGVEDYIQVRSIMEFVPQTISVAWGTPVTDIPYPIEVVAVTSQDEFINMAVSWNLGEYDPMVPGTTTYSGEVKVPEGMFNAYNRVPMLEITVQSKPAPVDVMLNNSEFIGSTDSFFQEIGTFTVIDPSDDVHGFMLPEGEGDNGYFEVNSGSLFWSSSDEAAGQTDFTIVLKVTDRAGNELVKSFAVRRLRTPLEDLELNNSFTPNGDGMNETWGVPALRYYSGVRIQVFDNGGQRLFYTEDADIRWDGKQNGKTLPVGTYFYVVQVRETGETRRGVLNLLRQ